MAAKRSIVSSLRFGKQWIWFFTSIITLGVCYAIDDTHYTFSDTEYVHRDGQERLKSNPSGTVSPLHDFFVSIQNTGADFNPNVVNDYKKFD